MHEDDRTLVVRLKERDEAAFRELVEKYKKMAFAIARELLGSDLDAEDISQEAFMKVFTSIEHFRGEARFSSWFYRIVVNCCVTRRRRKSYSSEQLLGEGVSGESETLMTATEYNPERQAHSSLLHGHIERALERLSDKQRAIFVLRHYHDLSLQEISEVVSCSVGTVKSQLFRTMRKLQKSLSFYRSELSLE